MNELSDEQKIEALMKATPLPPRKHELGGGYYYKCHWLECDADVKTWQNYCDQCGQRILWEGADE